jgi:hypothetical protein
MTIQNRHQFNQQFIDDLIDVWKKHGREAMEVAATEDPTAFVRVATTLIPKELAVAVDHKSSIQGLTDKELDTLIGLLKAVADRLPVAHGLKPDIVFEYVGKCIDNYSWPEAYRAGERRGEQVRRRSRRWRHERREPTNHSVKRRLRRASRMGCSCYDRLRYGGA